MHFKLFEISLTSDRSGSSRIFCSTVWFLAVASLLDTINTITSTVQAQHCHRVLILSSDTTIQLSLHVRCRRYTGEVLHLPLPTNSFLLCDDAVPLVTSHYACHLGSPVTIYSKGDCILLLDWWRTRNGEKIGIWGHWRDEEASHSAYINREDWGYLVLRGLLSNTLVRNYAGK